MITLLHQPSRRTQLRDVRIVFVDNPWDREPELAARRAQWVREHSAERNDSKLAVVAVRDLASPIPEIVLCESDWAMSQVGHDLVGDRIAPGVTSGQFRARVPNTAVVHTCLVTADGVAILSHRRDDLRYYPGKWSATFEEGLEPIDRQVGQNPLVRGVIRGTAEEFGPMVAPFVTEPAVEFAGVLLDEDINNLAVIAVAHLSASFRDVVAAAVPALEEIGPQGLDGYKLSQSMTTARRPNSVHTVGNRALGERDLHPTSLLRLELAQRSLNYGVA